MNRQEYEDNLSLFLQGREEEIKDLDAFKRHIHSSKENHDQFIRAIQAYDALEISEADILNSSVVLKSESDALKSLMKEGLKGDDLLKSFEEKIAKENQADSPIIITHGETKNTFNIVAQAAVIPIIKAGRVIIEYAGNVLFDKVLRIEDFRGVIATATDYNSANKQAVKSQILVEKDGIRIEIEKGVKEGKLIIRKIG